MANAALSNKERAKMRKAAPAAPRYPKAGEAAKVVKVAIVPDTPPPIVRDGLAWLAGKRVLSGPQVAEAMRYRRAFRDAGEVSLKSCLNVVEGGPGTGRSAMPLASPMVSLTAAKRALLVCRFQVLRGQVDMLTVMDGVCGQGWTTRELAGGDKHRARDLEVVLKVALDLLLVFHEAAHGEA